MKRILKTFLSAALALLTVLVASVGAVAADAPLGASLGATQTETTEIPLLIIGASFDANGNGKNDYNPGDTKKLFANPDDEFYGEQWAELSAETYYDKFFGGGYSVANFYKEMTLGKLYFVPLKLDKSNGKNTKDGCIDVVVNQIHPSAYTKKYKGSESERQAFCRDTITNIIMATDEYIDYSKYDKNGNGVLEATELLIVIMNAGPSQETTQKSEGNYDRGYFAVWSTSQGTDAAPDGVRYGSAITNMGEYTTQGQLQYTGTAAHELCHNLGAEDTYDRKVGASNTSSNARKTPWPFMNWFSLQCSGNYSGTSATGGKGSTPTYLDPYQRVYLGWAEEVVVGEGEYTLYSTCTGKYQVLRVNTPDPDEYYLIELRLKEGFEVDLAKGQGGICVWHIDETTNRQYFLSGTACSNYPFGGKYHDPGIVVCHSYNNTFYGVPNSTPGSDPFFYAGAKSRHNLKFESMNYRSPLQDKDTGDYGLNTYPAGWVGEKYFNLIVEPLDAPGQQMRVKITIDARGGMKPTSQIDTFEVGATTLTASGTLGETTMKINEYGFMISKDINFESDVTKLPIAKDGETVTFENLETDTRYYARMYIDTDYGSSFGMTRQFKTETTKSTLVPHNVEAEAVTVEVGEKYPDIPVGTREGYRFDGWYADEALTTPFDITAPASVVGNVHIWAKWTEIPADATTEATQTPSTPTDSTSGTDKPASSGCGSFVASASALTVVAALAGAVLTLKRKKER